MTSRSVAVRVLVAAAFLAGVAGCGGDDGASLRNITDEPPIGASPTP
ncbi:MAG TPA: hypothetical protein VM347_10370 [Nonomuraea sp.]|nr:hypothetical protein [Nonomuraea sp.]